jgi:hypothetical protein
VSATCVDDGASHLEIFERKEEKEDENENDASLVLK